MDLALQARRERQQARGACPAGLGRGYLRTLPNSDALETLAYRFAILGYIFWTFTLIGLFADPVGSEGLGAVSGG